MMNFVEKLDVKKAGIFAAGVLFGTAGLKILSGRDAKKVYTHGTAAVLRAKDCVMQKVTDIQENAEDIYAEAQQINEERAEEKAEFADACDCDCGCDCACECEADGDAADAAELA